MKGRMEMTVINFSESKKAGRKQARPRHLFLASAAILAAIGIVLAAVDHTYAQQFQHDDSDSGQKQAGQGDEQKAGLESDQEREEMDNPARNPSGRSLTISTSGNIDFSNPFFRALGTNGRTCATCHQLAEGWSISAKEVRERFFRTRGEDPVFRLIDGANCPTADVSSMEDREEAYSLLLNKGLIRIPRAVPPTAQFTVIAIDDPYQCSTPTSLSLYRRPLPATNLKFLSAVMWDGRETLSRSFPNNLFSQALHATLAHAEPVTAPDDATLRQIVDFELALFTAQISDEKAHSLTADGAAGGPEELSKQDFFIGINSGLSPSVPPFDNHAFNLFAQWSSFPDDGDEGNSVVRARQAIARGEDLFNTLEFEFTGVPGFKPGTVGFCTTCHSSPNAGGTSIPAVINIGTADASRRTPDLPLFTLQDKKTGKTVQTTDPGAALTFGFTSLIGAFKTPILRGLAARAPYFHDGSAATLEEVVDFYNLRFNIGLAERQKSDLAAFLRSL
jgi:cytochrome c peroxidase